jgi:type II secretory pathway component PulM
MGDKVMRIGKWDLSQLSQRERWMVLGGGLFLLLVLIYLWVWSPFFHALDTLREQVASKRRIESLLDIQGKQAQQLKEQSFSSVQMIKPSQWLPRIESDLVKVGLKPYLSNIQKKKGGVLIQFKAVSFDALMNWLQLAWKQYGLSVRAIKVKKVGKGLVTGSLEF